MYRYVCVNDEFYVRIKGKKISLFQKWQHRLYVDKCTRIKYRRRVTGDFYPSSYDSAKLYFYVNRAQRGMLRRQKLIYIEVAGVLIKYLFYAKPLSLYTPELRYDFGRLRTTLL